MCVLCGKIYIYIYIYIPVLFNIYFSKIIQEFKSVTKKDIPLNNRKILNTLLYADDQILMATSEDELQIMA